MKLIKGSLVGLVLASILAIAPTAAFARGGGGGGHGGGGGGHVGGGGRHGGGFDGGHGHFGGFASHGFAAHEGAHGWHRGHYGYGGDYWGGGPYWGWYGDPYSYDYPYYGDYSDAQTAPSEVAPSEQTIVAVQKELAKLGYYHGQIDGIVDPETQKAIRWFQSVDKLSVSGRIDDPTLKALQIS